MNAVRFPALACALGFSVAVSTSAVADADKKTDTELTTANSSALAQQPTQTVAMNTAPERMKLSPKPERSVEPTEPSQLLLMLATFAGLFLFLAHRRSGQD